MKKILGIVVAVPLLLAAGLPPVVGGLVEDTIRTRTVEGAFGEYLDIRLVEYERGLYASTAVLELRVDSSYLALLRTSDAADSAASDGQVERALEGLAGDMGVRLVWELSHGPVGFSGGPFVGLAGGTIHPELSGGELEGLRRRLDVPYLLEVRRRIGFGGRSRLELILPTVDIQREATAVTFRGWEGWPEYHPDTRRIAGRAEIGTLGVADERMNLRVESLSADVEGTIEAPRLLVGEGGFRVERLSLLRPLEDLARADVLGFRATGGTVLSGDGDALNTSFTYAVDTPVLGQRTLHDAELRMAALNVDREAAERWAVFTEEAALRAGEANPEVVGEEMEGLIHDFLATEPVLEVDPARFRYADQHFRAHLRVGSDASALPEPGDFEVSAGSLAFWSRLFRAEAELEASRTVARTLVAESQERSIRARASAGGMNLPGRRIEELARQQAEALLSGLVEGGFLAEDGDRYVSELTYRDGQLTASGQALSLPGA